MNVGKDRMFGVVRGGGKRIAVGPLPPLVTLSPPLCLSSFPPPGSRLSRAAYFLWVEQPAQEQLAPQEQESPHILKVVGSGRMVVWGDEFFV